MTSNLEHKSPIGKSDHMLLYFKYNCYVEKKFSKSTKFAYDRGDYVSLKTSLTKDWGDYLKESSVEEMWKKIKDEINQAVAENIPKRTIQNKFQKYSKLQYPQLT